MKALKRIYQKTILSIVLITLFTSVQLFAQTDSTVTEEPVVEESTLISPTIDFITVQKGDNTIDLKAGIRAKVNGALVKFHLLKITFVQVTESGDKVLGFVLSKQHEKAVFNTKTDSLITNAEGMLHFKAIFAGNKAMEPAEEEILIKRARLEIVPIKEDSLLTVQLKLIDLSTGLAVPVPETALGIFVNRLYNPLKIGEGTTDENGEVTIEVPATLPGDTTGNIALLAKLDEHELYGNLEAGVTQKWGVPVSNKIEMERALWSSYTPMWMIILFSIMMAVVWGHFIVIIYQLIRLRNEEPKVLVNTKNC